MIETVETSAERDNRPRDGQVSTDGKWRSFAKVPNLLQYVPSGVYFGRTKINGKLIRKSLKTAVWTNAKLRLTDFLKEQHESRGRIQPPKFSEAVERFKRELASATDIKPQSKQYRLWCLLKIEKTWPKLWELRIDEITPQACKEWAAELNDAIACHYYNNTIGTLKQILASGIKMHRENGGTHLDNPAEDLKRTRVTQKDLQLPEASQFKALVQNLRTHSGGWGPRVADLVEFLAYSGLRIQSEAMWVNWKDIDWKRKEIIVRGHPETGTKNSELRRVPIIQDMERLLKRMKRAVSEPTGRILQVSYCNAALKRACSALGIPRMKHHDLRHLFATRCIESDVPIVTVSRWLGHKDGGALAMKTYGHLRNEHSQAMAKKVKF